jgi:hypothetical protein
MSTLYVDTLEPNQNTAIDVAAGKLKAVGSVVQIQESTMSGSAASVTASSFTDTGLSVNITPKFATSKILVFVNTVIGITRSTNARIDFRCLESNSSTEVIRHDYTGAQAGTISFIAPMLACSGVFQCSNTSQLTFKVQAQRANGASTEAGLMYLKWYSGGFHTIQALEIAQ